MKANSQYYAVTLNPKTNNCSLAIFVRTHA